MKILLINNNPVVSRLTALSARKEEVEIDEIQEVTELNSDRYDIVFVDGDSLSKDVRDVINENINVQKSVLFYTEDDKAEQSSFDMAILKPFLPSEVSAVIRSIEENIEKEETDKEEKSQELKEEHFNILDEPKKSKSEELLSLEIKEEKKIEKKEQQEEKELFLPLDQKEEKEDFLSLDLKDNFDLDLDLTSNLEKEKEKPSVEKKEEVLEEKTSFEEKLEEAFPLKNTSLDEDLFELDLDKDKLSFEDELFSTEEKKDEEKNEILFEKEKIEEVESFVKDTYLDDIQNIKGEKLMEEESILKSNDSFKDELLAFNLNDELLDDPILEKREEKVEMTKVLDENEIANIKDILEDDSVSDMSLEDLMSPPIASAVPLTTDNDKKAVESDSLNIHKETKTKEDKEEKEEQSTIPAGVLLESVSNMSIETLRELLAGSEINISIKFPESK